MTITTSRKTLGLLGASIAILSLPVLAATPASAASGSTEVLADSSAKIDDELNLIGRSSFRQDGGLYVSKHIAKSGGGKFRDCMYSPKPNGGDEYLVYEWDKGSNKDERVSHGKLTEKNNCGGTNNASQYVDGSDKKAEFYAVTADGRAKNMNIAFYD
ncbi:hypothetical protein ACTWQF_08455 [Streptomyces sp. 8N114]|uniref:hypothetical protein n=1 Tax=Streptomyces sp. 8N114 TaxID=3457419 RepID=UPI003FD0795E